MLVALLPDVVASLGFSKDQGRRPVRTLVRLAGGNQVLAALVAKVVEWLGIGVDYGCGSVSHLVRLSRWLQELVPCVVLVVDSLGFRENQLSRPTSRCVLKWNTTSSWLKISRFVAWSVSLIQIRQVHLTSKTSFRISF